MYARMQIGRILTATLMSVCLAIIGIALSGCAMETEEGTLDIWIDRCLSRIADDPYNRAPLTIRTKAPVEFYWLTDYYGEPEPFIIRSVDDPEHCILMADAIVCTERLDPGLYELATDVDHRHLVCVTAAATVSLF